jgi:hypothetical protein
MIPSPEAIYKVGRCLRPSSGSKEIVGGSADGYNEPALPVKPGCAGGVMIRDRGWFAMVALFAASLACAVPPSSGSTASEATGEAAGSAVCDTPARLIQLNRLYREEMPAATGPYPANCLYYCVWLRDAAGSLSVDVREASTDLDLFIGIGSIEAVSGEEIVEGETFTWKSNQPGDIDERVEIPSPAEGVYYLEICSYEGESTPFELDVRLR